MSRTLSEYSWVDWRHLRPLSHALKTRRYAVIDRRGLANEPNAVQFPEIIASLRDQRLIVTIAFNDPQLIELQIAALATHLSDFAHLIVDNSSQHAAAEKIEQVCRDSEVGYLNLPHNPWQAKNPSRSHGFAMNWVYQHVIKKAEPLSFGYLDHDLFPTQSDDPFTQLNDSLCAGDKRWAGRRWFLWAGYCFFKFEQVKNLRLDFGLDWFAGLDTGGANWQVLYQHLNPERLPQRRIKQVCAIPDVPFDDAYFEWRGKWIHEVGMDGRCDLRPEKREILIDILNKTSRMQIANIEDTR